jgi:PAS domain S-box-containing protein
MIRVLIVDDKHENLYLLRALLEGHGWTVDDAHNGAEALTIAHQAPPDLIISDLLMPVMDGYMLLRRWKADEILQNISFVVYTATYTDPKDERLALDLGADAFIIKPVEPEPFMARILDVLAKKVCGKLQPSAPPIGDEVVLLKEYSEVLINKLEAKVFQLEQINRSLQDETARRQQAEAQLLQALRDWENIFQATGHPTIIMDLEHGIVAANKKCVEITGKSLDQLLNAKCYDVFHTNGKRPQDCPMEALLKSGSTERVEMEMEALGGHYLVSCMPIIDEHGNIMKVIHAATDITERREMEKELRKSEDRFRRIYDDAPVMMHSVDTDLIIRNVNKKWLEILGYNRDEILGKSIESIMTPESKTNLRERIAEFWNVGEVHDIAYEYIKKDGTALNVLLDAIAWDDPTRGTVSRSVVRDVTQRRLLQKQLLQAQKMEAIGTLAGGIAHDFNNILQVVLGYSDLLLGDKKSEDPGYDELRKISRAARSGADLVRQILTFSRKAEVSFRPIDLNSEIRKAEQLLRRTIPRIIELELYLGERLRKVNADPGQIEQILLNLAVNAKDAMPHGGRIVIETENAAIDETYIQDHLGIDIGEYVLLTFSDTGVGIYPDVLDHIFEPFYTTKKPGEGTGLGLATIYGIVKQHDGNITCYSEPERGTTFKIYLPVIPTEEVAIPEQFEALPAGGTETILLVDDEYLIRELGGRVLSKAGYTVLKAGDGAEALETYRQKMSEIDVVVLDIIMPRMDGQQCMEELLKLDPSVKVIIASGYSAGRQAQRTIRSGAKGFIGKPFDTKQMLKELRNVLDRVDG